MLAISDFDRGALGVFQTRSLGHWQVEHPKGLRMLASIPLVEVSLNPTAFFDSPVFSASNSIPVKVMKRTQMEPPEIGLRRYLVLYATLPPRKTLIFKAFLPLYLQRCYCSSMLLFIEMTASRYGSRRVQSVNKARARNSVPKLMKTRCQCHAKTSKVSYNGRCGGVNSGIDGH